MIYYLWCEKSGALPEIFQGYDSLRTAEQVCTDLNSANCIFDSAAIWYVTSEAGEVLA